MVPWSVRWKIGFLLWGVLAALVPAVTTHAQLSLFMENLPNQGDWVEYDSVTTDSTGEVKQETIRVALVGEEMVGEVPHVWFEFSPIKFVGDDKGTLKLLIKKDPSQAEIEDPLSMSQKLVFQAPGKDPILVEKDTIRRATSLAGSLKMSVAKEFKADTELVSGENTLTCKTYELDSWNELDGTFTRKTVLVYKGELQLCDGVPFHIAQADLTIEKTKKKRTKKKTQVLKLKGFGFGEATSQVSGTPKKKGLLDLILMD